MTNNDRERNKFSKNTFLVPQEDVRMSVLETKLTQLYDKHSVTMDINDEN